MLSENLHGSSFQALAVSNLLFGQLRLVARGHSNYLHADNIASVVISLFVNVRGEGTLYSLAL